jgi:asparagine synthase (glutamine-hydrolysing)
MCAICGIFRPDGKPIDLARVERMRDAMAARGPDGAGARQGAGYALGHRRLAVIDLSEAGLQPMASEDESVQIVFNGEIYNYSELRPELEAAGHQFHSQTDTEVLVHGYEAWGLEGLLKRLRGMYAFAIVDLQRHEIHLARDPLGKKPLFFYWVAGELTFASSARALALGLEVMPEIDPMAIDDLLWNLYIPGPRTLLKGAEKLLPGRALSLGRDGKRRDLVHWQPDFFHPWEGLDEHEWLERIEGALTTAVKRRLVADVPVGVMLSGGVDSSLVTAMAARVVGRVQSFSVATEDPALDESSYARSVAERYGTDHHELPVRSSVRQDLPRLVAAMGEPLADASAANLFAIAQVARESVTVALTGDGGDEGFGGYHHFWAYHIAGRLRRFLPQPFCRPVARMGQILQQGPGLVYRAGSLLGYTASPVDQSYLRMGWLDVATRAALFTPSFRARLGEHFPTQHYQDVLANGNGALPVNRVMQLYMQTILPDDLLAKVDLATMGASLEARCPFLDQDLIELAMRIPAAIRFSGGQRKGLLRQLARRLLPTETVDRRKQGFVAPIGRWLRHDWSDLVDDLILGPHVEQRGWFERETLQRFVEEHRQGRDHAYLLWTLVILELWVRISVDGTLAPGDTL